MSERKGLEKNISVRLIITITIGVICVFLIVVSLYFKNNLIQAVLGSITIIVSIYSVAQHRYEKNLSSTKTNINVHSFEDKAIITCTLKSSHPKRLFIDKAYLFVDRPESVENNSIQNNCNKVCKFKHILRHEYGEVACLVEKQMTAGNIKSYNDINPDGNGVFFELMHLSSATILYLDPHEEFSDECVVELDRGVYRAMFIVTFKNADCNCSIKHFFVGENAKL